MSNLENDIPKYKKKKKSTISKSREKSKHKHEYTEKCIVKYPTPLFYFDKISLGVATYCKYCGKIESIRKPNVERDVDGKKITHYMTNEEILETYKDLEVVEISDYFQKYVPVSKGGE